MALVGCSPKEAKDDGKTTVRFSTWDSEKSLDMQQQLVDKFNEEHKDIKIVELKPKAKKFSEGEERI